MRGTERALNMMQKMSALPLTVWLAQILTTCAFQANMTTHSMDSTTTASQDILEPNKHHMTSDTSIQMTTASQYAVQQLTHGLLPNVEVSGTGHDTDVNRNAFTNSAGIDKETSTFLHKIPSPREMSASENPTTVATQMNSDEASTVEDPLTGISQSTEVTPRKQPGPASTMPTPNTATPMVQELTSDGATTYISTPTADDYTQVPFKAEPVKSTKKPLLSSYYTTAISEAQTSLKTREPIQEHNTTQRNITAIAEEDSPTDTPPIQDLSSDGATTYINTPTADNYTQVPFEAESVQSTNEPLLPSNTEAISEDPTSSKTAEPIKENITTQRNITNSTEKDSTSDHTHTWTTDTPSVQEVSTDGATTYNSTPTADNYTGAPFGDEQLRNTTEYLMPSTTKPISEGQTSQMTVETIQEYNTTQRNITGIIEKDLTSEHTNTWTTGAPLIQDLTSDGTTIYSSIESTVDPSQAQTVYDENTLSTEEPLATNATTGMTSEDTPKTESESPSETTLSWASLSTSTNISENISSSDPKQTQWPSCMNTEEDPPGQSWHMSRLICFITIWSLAMAATIFLGVTIFLWVRLSVVKKRANRRGWSLKDTGGSGVGGTEQKSLWAEHNSSAAERVEFWYANGTTMEADKKGEKTPKERKKKKQKKQTDKEEEICIQPRVTIQDISQFWYSNGQVRNGRVPCPLEDL